MRNFIDLSLKAKGKADLYFHAYFWHLFIQNLFLKAHPESTEDEFEQQCVQRSAELARLKGLAESLKKVHANILKFPFNKEIYEHLVEEFGGRKQVKKLKLLEDI